MIESEDKLRAIEEERADAQSTREVCGPHQRRQGPPGRDRPGSRGWAAAQHDGRFVQLREERGKVEELLHASGTGDKGISILYEQKRSSLDEYSRTSISRSPNSRSRSRKSKPCARSPASKPNAGASTTRARASKNAATNSTSATPVTR